MGHPGQWVFLKRRGHPGQWVLLERMGQLVPETTNPKPWGLQGRPGHVVLPVGFRMAIFTTLGATGRRGPKNRDKPYRGQDHEMMVTLKKGIQFFTVPQTGNYTIEAAGAAAGWTGGNKSNRGKGAKVMGTFHLEEGEELKILVGQEGVENRKGPAAGGGGGTFVTKSDDSPLIIAGGGGGGTRDSSHHAQCDGTVDTSGQAGYVAKSLPHRGGSHGEGAMEGTGAAGGGGGGLLTNGGGHPFLSLGNRRLGGGSAFVTGGLGGKGILNTKDGYGGFGGGGGGYGFDTLFMAPGGGGGYSGGGRGVNHPTACGGGGGSFNVGTDRCGNNGDNDGPGYVVITRM
ncbi:hypothetical protein Bbelb_130020 [Branchiostoma belcheri]|nr:hypothetical protein Bbelb_130020 [Branchiostoma belcheri]